MNISTKNMLKSGNHNCKCPERALMHWKESKEANMAGAKWFWRRVVAEEVREETVARKCDCISGRYGILFVNEKAKWFY